MRQSGIVTAILVTAAAVGGIVVILNRRRLEQDKQTRDISKSKDLSPYSGMIAEKLGEFDGEDTPILHAFEEALEQESHHERQLARDVGLA